MKLLKRDQIIHNFFVALFQVFQQFLSAFLPRKLLKWDQNMYFYKTNFLVALFQVFQFKSYP